MQRKPTKNTRGPNAEEKRFMAYTKESDCIACNHPGPSIVHHCEGATFRHNKVLIGHAFVIPLCQSCDDVITQGSRKKFREEFGPQSMLWHKHLDNSPFAPPGEVYHAIMDYGL
jgi:hypothetical protein